MGRRKSNPRHSQNNGMSVLTQPGQRLEAQKAVTTPKEPAILTTHGFDGDDLVDTPPSTPKKAKLKRLDDLAQRQAGRGRHRIDGAKTEALLFSLFNVSVKDDGSTEGCHSQQENNERTSSSNLKRGETKLEQPRKTYSKKE